jgi:hypothetical protein
VPPAPPAAAAPEVTPPFAALSEKQRL